MTRKNQAEQQQPKKWLVVHCSYDINWSPKLERQKYLSVSACVSMIRARGDKGDGTLSDLAGGRLSVGTINYTSGYFHCTMSSSSTPFNAGYFSYTTYYFNSINSSFPIRPTEASGAMSATLTVPSIWNGSETVWVVDEKGNVGSLNFTVTGSNVVPEPLTFGGVVVLSSAALVISVYLLRKKPVPKVAA